MRILFTGGSSFTGFWFLRTLCEANHEVVAIFRRPLGEYTGIRGERVGRMPKNLTARCGISFGDDRFIELIEESSHWDILCHHAAEVANYKSDNFDVVAALKNNTHGLPRVLEALASRSCQRVVLTGSVFETGEGVGSDDLPAFSPYGLSKALTAQVFDYYRRRADMHLGKFVIPNPFGPFEEARFTNYLMRCWAKHEVAQVNAPDYVRDNIHVSLLALSYVRFVEQLPATPGVSKMNPSGYVESQGEFALRFAGEMRSRISLDCEVALNEQLEFTEPRIRVNCDPVDYENLDWSEKAAWDELAKYYRDAGLGAS